MSVSPSRVVSQWFHYELMEVRLLVCYLHIFGFAFRTAAPYQATPFPSNQSSAALEELSHLALIVVAAVVV